MVSPDKASSILAILGSLRLSDWDGLSYLGLDTLKRLDENRGVLSCGNWIRLKKTCSAEHPRTQKGLAWRKPQHLFVIGDQQMPHQWVWTLVHYTWKQPKCPSTEEWIKKMKYMYTVEYYSAIKREWNNAIGSNMDGPRNYHIKWSKSDRKRQISYDITYMWNLKKMVQMNLFIKQK